MIKLNVIEILEKKGKTKYWLFNQINNSRSKSGNTLISYTNFQNLVEQKSQSIRYDNIEELCQILQCEISDLLKRD